MKGGSSPAPSSAPASSVQPRPHCTNILDPAGQVLHPAFLDLFSTLEFQAKPFPRLPLPYPRLPLPYPPTSLPDTMALVAPPTSVWRDPNLMANPSNGITSMGINALGLHPGLHSSGGLSPTTPQVAALPQGLDLTDQVDRRALTARPLL